MDFELTFAMNKAMGPKVLLSFWMILTWAVQDALICPAGKYFFNGVCVLCADNCSTCHSASICSECKAGYYGELCAMTCNSNCRDNECEKSKGVCISCSEGYFKDTDKNCMSCPSNCSLCSAHSLCTKCKIGFKGRQCQEVCSDCKPGTSCDIWTGECNYECKQGLTGAACDKKCNSKCSLCQRLHADMCIACSNEKYGETCEKECSIHCVNKTCDDANGFCTHGCQDGYWGTLCEEKCMTGCSSSICDRQNGSCLSHYPGGDMGTERNCPKDCSCDAQVICRECDRESEFMCGKQCPLSCRKHICFRNTSLCLLSWEDLNTQPSKQSAGTIILCLAVVLTGLGAFIFCYKCYRFRKSRAQCHRSTATGNIVEYLCRKRQSSDEKTRTEDDSRASSKDINDVDTFQENAPLQRSL